MSEYIIEIPDEYFASYDAERDMYYPDERDSAMRITPIVRCRDCVAYEPYHTYAGMKLDYGECMQHRRQTNDDRFCWWAERSDK